jgi:hypothetical protein
MVKFIPVHGTVMSIDDLVGSDGNYGCDKMFSVDLENGSVVNFIVTPATYFVNGDVVFAGDRVTGYYDGNAPALLIYPPQYTALVMAKDSPYQSVKVDYFNTLLISSDGQLKLNIAYNTPIMLTNNQPFFGDITNRNLIAVYSIATRSIPAQTTPDEVIALCL